MNQYRHGAISFTVDTSYLEWKTKFPSIIFCEKKNFKSKDVANMWVTERKRDRGQL